MATHDTFQATPSQTVNWLQEYGDKGVDFIEKEAPQLCNEIVRVGILEHAFLP